jgi:hypothetical protein
VEQHLSRELLGVNFDEELPTELLTDASRLNGLGLGPQSRLWDVRTVIKKLEQRFNDMATHPQTIRADGGTYLKPEEFQQTLPSVLDNG